MEPRALAQIDLSRPALKSMVEYIRTYYLASNKSFRDVVQRENSDGFEFEFQVPLAEVGGQASDYTVGVMVVLTTRSVEATFSPPPIQDPRTDEIYERISDGFELAITNFNNKAKRTTLYFVFSPEGGARMEAPVPRNENMGRQVLKRLFRGNAMNMFLVLLLFGFVLVLLLGDAAILGIVAIQGVFLVFSDRLGMGVGDVHPSMESPDVTIVSVRTTPETATLLRKWGKTLLPTIKDSVKAAAAEGGDREKAIQDAIRACKVPCEDGDVKVVKRDVYGIVREVASKFKMPVPRISIANTPLDNASATGVSPSRSSITITAGAIEDLDDSQLQAIVGHELGHVKGRDPIILFFTTAVVYVGGFYLWLPLLYFLGVLYFLLAFAVIYSVGKLLETRADTESAKMLGEPRQLATALTNIGFNRLYYEKYSAGLRIFDWFNFDPHPPTYFRVQRLYRIAEQREKIAHTFLVSLRDCISGFGRALAGTA